MCSGGAYFSFFGGRRALFYGGGGYFCFFCCFCCFSGGKAYHAGSLCVLAPVPFSSFPSFLPPYSVQHGGKEAGNVAVSLQTLVDFAGFRLKATQPSSVYELTKFCVNH
jgi:hypothetical protein